MTRRATLPAALLPTLLGAIVGATFGATFGASLAAQPATLPRPTAPPAPVAQPAGQPAAVDTAYVRVHYVKREVRIPMRDGVTLFTSVYVPRDTTRTYPIMLNRTPYSVAPYGDAVRASLGPSPAFAREGFVFVYQDVRGRYMSQGVHEEMTPHQPAAHPNAQTASRAASRAVAAGAAPARGGSPAGGGAIGAAGVVPHDESTDAYDTIDWLLRNVPRNNGRVGIWGISYPGFYASASSIDAHPALVASSPQAPMTDEAMGDDVFHGGALMLPHNFGFHLCFGPPRREPAPPKPGCSVPYGTPDGYDFYLRLGAVGTGSRAIYGDSIRLWNELLEHPTYDDYWKARNIRPHLRDMRPAMLVVGGWYDAEDLFGALATYRSANAQSPRGDVRLVMGPWSHGQWSRGPGDGLGVARFGQATSEFYRDSIELPFFMHHLKGAPRPALPEAMMFETGSNRWTRHATWPPAGSRRMSLVLGADGTLTLADSGARAAPGVDAYVSDPAKPVPFIEGIATGMAREYMTADQRFASRRPDVLVYRSEPLTEDVTIAGPVSPRLRVSTTGTDADFVVKLIDVFPDSATTPPGAPEGTRYGGLQQLVRGEPMRARYRDSFETPSPLTPDRVTNVEWVMPDVNHTFRKGHRIMLQVQSTWFPLIDRNPQTYVESIFFAKPSDYRAQTMRVHRGGADPSRVEVLVMPQAER